jgi:hypothetical protein
MRLIRLGIAVVCLTVPQLAAGQGRAPMGPGQAGERQVQQAFARALRERVGLSDEQLRRLAPLSQGFEQRRRSLLQAEQATRGELRRELAADTLARQERVAASLDRLMEIQRQRLDLMLEEQKALAEFMTPVQRARYHALQETVRRGAEDMRRRRMQGSPPPGRRGPPSEREQR